MKREARPVLMGEQREAVAEALLAQQVATHRANTRYAVGGSGITALLLMAMEWRAVPATVLLAWLGGVVMVLGLRLIVGVAHRRAAPDPTSNRAWLRRYRVGFLAHGIIWGLASVMPLPRGDGLHLAILIVVLVSMTASNFTLTAFDLPSALFFGVPVLGLLSARLVAQGDATYWPLGAAAMVVLVFLSLTARRAQQVVRSYVALRLVEAAQAQALRSSEEFLERTGATAGVGGWVLDPMTMSLRLTAQACRIHDFEAMARPGFETFLQRYDPSEHARIRLAVDAVAAHGTPFDLELPLATAGGQQRWVRLIGEAQLESGKAVRVSGVVQDITQAKITALALAEKHHLLTLLVRTTSQGYWFVDADGVTTDVNPAMCEILRCTREDIIGQRIFAFVDAANAAIFREQMAQRDRGVLGSYEVTLTRPDGTQVDCFNNATPIFETGGRRIGSVGMWTDISERKQAEQRLRATSELLIQKTQALQVTLDSITQGIVSTDAAGHFTVYNRRLLEMLDLPESIVAPGKTIDDSLAFQTERGDFGAGLRFIDPVTRRFVAASDHQSVPEYYVRETPSGGQLEVRTRRLPDGGMVRTLTDVTAYFEAQQALHDSEAELRALLDALPGYIVVLDSNFAYTYVNEQFTTLIGRSRDDIVGRPVREVLGEAGSARIREHASRVRPGGPVTIESEYEATADRPKIWLQVTYAVGADAGTGHHKFYAFGIDISARKAAEEALIAAKDEAERANRAKSQFLSSMSHELRTPMNAILGFGQLLVSDPVDPLADRQRGHVQEILRGARHLLKLINEVLDLALVETGKLQVFLEPVPLAKLLQECLGLLRPLIRNDAIDVSVVDEAPCDCVVVADRTRLKQVLLNLLSNAVKYNRAGGQVRIACTPDGDAVRVGISDNGPGLSPDQGARLFQAFERLEAGKTRVEGAGLGLALSKRLMDAMGGGIGLESEAGVGSTFWIRLPRAAALDGVMPAEPSGFAPLAAPASALRMHKVLYIEDNPINVLVMQAMLERLPDLRLLVAPLPALGLQMAIDERPDLILLDIQLPGMDGFEVMRRLRLEEASRAIPVIAVSANAMAGDIERAMATGFVQYLTKPVDLPQLLAAVAAALPAR